MVCLATVSTGLPPFLPASLARDTVESLRHEQGYTAFRLYTLLIIGGACALAALPLVKIDRYVLAAGVLQAPAERTALRAGASGTIAEILVRENDRVKAGQPLVLIDTSDLDQRLSHARENQAERAVVASDLAFLADHVVQLKPTDVAANPSQTLEGFVSEGVSKLQSPTILSAFRHLAAQLQPQLLEARKANSELTRLRLLARSGLVPPAELEAASFEFERLTKGMDLLFQQARAQWLAQLREERNSIRISQNDEHALLEARKLRTITAPVDGVVLGIAALARDTFVTAGQDVGSLSPDGELIVQAYVHSRDIVRLHPGQRARIEADVFPTAVWNLIRGTVIAISDDRVESPLSTTRGFRVTVQLDRATLATSTGQLMPLRKGLAVGVRLIVGRESLLSVLLNRSSDWISPFGRG